MLVSAVIVGDEILAGHVQDANTHFIAGRVAEHGHHLHRVVVVGDDPSQIADEVARDLDRVELIVVCGGLGPTHDDRTMEGVARALGVALEPCPDLEKMIEDVVAQVGRHGFSWDAFGVDGLRKMALAPRGASILRCSIGVVPAVTVEDPRARVVILPGPPRELQAVFLESVEPVFLAGTGRALAREEVRHPFPESTLAGVLVELEARFTGVSIGSYPQTDHVLVRVAGERDAVAGAADELRAHIERLTASPEGAHLLDVLSQLRRGRGA